MLWKHNNAIFFLIKHILLHVHCEYQDQEDDDKWKDLLFVVFNISF